MATPPMNLVPAFGVPVTLVIRILALTNLAEHRTGDGR